MRRKSRANFPKAVVEWNKGNEVYISMLVFWYGRMVGMNDWLMEVGESLKCRVVGKFKV